MQPTVTIQRIIKKEHTASSMKSGSLDVLSTPQLICWMEEASCLCVELDEAFTSVGIEMNMKHKKASPIGKEISIVSTLLEQEEKLLIFKVEAFQDGDCIRSGIHKRYIVDIDTFISKL